jgi:Ala-tRNA(Pro) deacylase
MPKSPEDLFTLFQSLGITHETIEHAPVFTVVEAQNLRGAMPGGHTKNLFLKDRKDQLFLVVAEEETRIDLKTIHEKIGGQGKVSFASADLLREHWGVEPGSVTPFGAINDQAGRITVVLDEAMMRHERLNFHPLVNTMTTGVTRDALIIFLNAVHHKPLVVSVGSQEQADPPS